MADLLDIREPTPLGPPRLGLLASIEVVSDPLLRTGIKFTPEPCGGEGGAFDPTCGVTVDISGDKATVIREEDYVAFGVFEPESCSTFGFGGVDVLRRAERALALDESKQVEREFWTGAASIAMAGGAALSSNRWLARNVAGPQSGGTFPPAVTQLQAGAALATTNALAELEQAIAESRSGGRGMIHCAPYTATFWIRDRLLYRSGNMLLTVAKDTIVVPGEGYPGTSPAGAAMPANHSTGWAYATGLVRARRGPVETIEPHSPELTTLNRRTAIARSLWALEIDPCVYAAVKVTHT